MRHHIAKAFLLFLFTTLCEAALFAGLTAFIAAAYMHLPHSLSGTLLHGALLAAVWLLVVANIPPLVAAVTGAVRARWA